MTVADTWSQSDIDTLRAAIRTGILTVSYDGPPKRLIQYQALSEMRSLLAEMVAAVDTTAGTRRPFRFATHSKGFDSDSDT